MKGFVKSPWGLLVALTLTVPLVLVSIVPPVRHAQAYYQLNDEFIVPDIQTVTLTNADTEYTLTLPTNCKQFSMQARQDASFRVADTTGLVATPTGDYVTVKASGAFSSKDDMAYMDGVLYLASGTAGTVVEFWGWKKKP